ncbi:MAG: hypothetical protein BGP13_08335 [Sphingobacteriales bacterium 40-81]|nr:MAG: hypothetical protein BGP13_08335 [Sphingobacteriales bacterium 40-81]
MLKDYFKIAWRNLRKSPIFSFINIAGLTIGITSFLLIALYIFDEFTFDRFHRNGDHIYRIIDNKISAEGKASKTTGTGYQVAQRSTDYVPEIKSAARLSIYGRVNVATLENNNVFYEDFIAGSQDFFKVFDFTLLEGNRNTALSVPHSIVITEETAKKLFGVTSVLNKTLRLGNDTTLYTIAGVLKDFPVNSSISFNMLFSESSITSENFKKFTSSDWNSGRFSTYFLLADKADPLIASQKLNDMVSANYKNNTGIKGTLSLQSMKDVHFHSADIEGYSGRKGNITYVYVFLIIGFFVLFIACINYMNLATARFTSRTKEIAVRKVAGASRKLLIGQFLSEAFLVTVIATVLALILTKVFLPAFNSFAEKKLTLDLNTDHRIWTGVVLIIFMVSLLSGLYPALFQSGLKPLLLLKSKVQPGKWNISLRKSLVIFQFSLSAVMIFATIIIYKQMRYIDNKHMGFDKEGKVVIDINSGKVRRAAETIKNELSKLSEVTNVSVTSRVPGEWKTIPVVKIKNGNATTAQGVDMYFLGVDENFLSTYNVELLRGRNFNNGNTLNAANVLINEAAAKELNITEPAGQLITIPSANFGGDFSILEKPFVATVAGIVRDFNFQSLHEPLAPMVLAYQDNPIHSIDYFTVSISSSSNTGKVLSGMEEIIRKIDQTHLFEYHFLDKQWELLYREDKIRQTIFFIIALLAIFIAALGLLGLTAFAAEQRVKEIGIRKVLGANAQSIVMLLSKDFLKLVLIASAIAFPIGWFSMNKWLNDFAYRIDMRWWMYALAVLTAIIITVVTISFQAIKAAMANPVKSLRTE